MSFNDYKKEDSSVVSDRLRSDFTNTFDIMLTKAIGDFFPAIDQNRNLFINLSYEKVISEANTLNYDYIADSFSMSLTKSFWGHNSSIRWKTLKNIDIFSDQTELITVYFF